ncbi:LysR family transcriptional regulator [Mesoterricola silvestris]|uniref:HTH-type transcriptional regulator BsdA n=1 Tax=Mesoterricola silvestris TaxID=2927979 RepID=A0AA48KB18_9BACT|nr:LysR family transcriptional regulator [Mesoterricola silvestris]BDU73882.1 HTH-type transcriptional regulator BsdA [Mesoterricola silvestris]
MDTKRLTYFCTIVEQGQISRAARLLNMSQPPLSQRLKELEDELGVQLIIREGHAWQVTESGQLLYERARQVLDQLGDLPSEVKNVADGLSGTIRIGTSSVCASTFLKVLPSLHRRYPRLKFSLLISDSSDLANHVDSRELDFAILLLPVPEEGYTVRLLPTGNLVVVLPPSLEPEGMPERVGVEHLAGIPLLCMRRWTGGGTYEYLLKAFQEKKIRPNILLDCPDVRTLLGCLLRGLEAAAIIPASEIPSTLGGRFSIHPLDLPGMSLHPALIHRTDRYLSQAARDVIETIVAG